MSSDEEGWRTDLSSDGVGGSDRTSGGSLQGEGSVGGGGEGLYEVDSGSEEENFSDEEYYEEVRWGSAGSVGRKDVDYYRRRWGWPLYAGAGVTLGETVYTYLQKKVDDCEGDTSCDKGYRLLHEVILPKPNLFPPSLYLIRRLAGVEDLDQYEYHVCVEDHYVWERIDKHRWVDHYEDKCPKCAASGVDTFRFKKLTGGRSVPAKVRTLSAYFS